MPLWSHRGSSRLRDVPVVDPALIRGLDVGQAAYISRGGVTYVQVKRLVTAPAALAPVGRPAAASGGAGQRAGATDGSATAVATAATADGEQARAGPSRGAAPPGPASPGHSPVPAGLPDVSALLDEAFGAEPGS